MSEVRSNPLPGMVTALVVASADRRLVSAVYHSVCDATRAALEVIAALTATGLRVVLCTAAADRDFPGGTALGNAHRLLATAGPGQILATAPTAVVAGPTLPAGIDLLDRGLWTPGPGQEPERVYEMRVEQVDASSNVAWARRAVQEGTGDAAGYAEAAVAGWSGAGRLVAVTGGSAAQRTGVVAELALRLHAEGALVLRGGWTGSPYGAFREAFGHYAANCGRERLWTDLEGWADEIAALLPEVGARVGGARLACAADGERLHDAVEAWLRALASRSPVVLVLEDAHLADGGSVSLMSHLWHACVGLPVLVVLAGERQVEAEFVEEGALVRVAL